MQTTRPNGKGPKETGQRWDSAKKPLNIKPGQLAHALIVSKTLTEESLEEAQKIVDGYFSFVMVYETLANQTWAAMTPDERKEYNEPNIANVKYFQRNMGATIAEVRRRFAERHHNPNGEVDLLERLPLKRTKTDVPD